MKILHILSAAFIGMLVFLPQAMAQDEPSHLVKIRLLPEYGAVQPGQNIWIGIEESIAPGWHTYWKNPGDSGIAPRVKWTLPEGFEIGDIQWPAPEKLPFGPLMNYGYKEHTILLQRLKTPVKMPDGPLTLSAKIEILVCREECIPEYGTYSLTLNGDEGASEDNSAYLKEAALQFPDYRGEAEYGEKDGNFILRFAPSNGISAHEITNAEFFPAEWGLVDNAAKPEISDDDGKLILKQKRGQRALKDIADAPYLEGVLRFSSGGIEYSAQLQARKIGAPMPSSEPAAQDVQNSAPMPDAASILSALVFALLGGLILNLMPCVFPVLSLKALSLVKISEKQPSLARMHGIFYTGGVVLSFMAIAAALIALQAAGNQIGWGFQLQSPLMVSALAYLLFIIGLNLSGAYEIGGGLGNFGASLTMGSSGLVNSFFMGVLATLVATPCTAPFMAGAVGFALVSPPVIALLIFAALGFGLALPYLALAFVPALRGFLPKPGPWMEVFRQFLAFPMFIAAIWLIWVLEQQAGANGIATVLLGMVMIALGIWLLGHQPRTSLWRTLAKILALLSFAVALFLLPLPDDSGSSMGPANPGAEESNFDQAFSQSLLDDVLGSSDPVFVEMTAAWCITCKVNHSIAINVDSTRDLFAAHNVQYLIGDWTNQDEEITKYLKSFGRNGVPLYVFYGRPNPLTKQRPEPVVLPQILTPGMIAETVENEGRKP